MKLLLPIFICLSSVLFGQEKMISGIVTDSIGELPGVTIREKGNSNATVSNTKGEFEIKVSKQDAILVFSYFGMKSKEVNTNGITQLTVTLSSSRILREFVVTAVGIEKNETSLGYAVTTVSGDELRETGQTNVLNSLNGKVPGASIISSSGALGGASRVVLRGETSITGNNQALIVVDGVRINNAEDNSFSSTDVGVANSNRLIDLNQEDIESVSVLKGGSASALYGMEGANGVIVITTKKGKDMSQSKKGFNVSVHSSLGFSFVNKLPQLQNKYAQGSTNTTLNPGGPGFPEYRGPETGWFTSWGPAISDLSYDGSSDYLYDQNGRIVSNQDPRATSPANNYDNLNNFFEMGINNTNDIAISGGNQLATYRLSVGNSTQTGVVPNNTLDRVNVKLASTLTLLDQRLTISNTSNFINSKASRIQQGSNPSGIMLGLTRTPISFDNSNGLDNPKDNPTAYTNHDGTQRSYRGGGGYDNPWWSVNNNPYTDNVNRIMGAFNSNYKFSELLNLGARVGYDVYTDQRQQIFAIGSRAFADGLILEESYTNSQFDLYLTASGKTRFLKNKMGLHYTAGINHFSANNTQIFARGQGFSFPGFEHISNASNQTSGRTERRQKSFSYFGSVDISYQNYLYVTLTGRQDYDSRLLNPEIEFDAKDISFFYPSAAVAFVFTEFMENKKILNFGKLRASIASLAKGPSTSYITGNTFQSNSPIRDRWTNGISFPFFGQTSFLSNNTSGNPQLRPEKSIEFEIGTELYFFDGRMDLDVAYYNRKTSDVIVPVSISGASGFTEVYLNSGEISTNGIDVRLGVKPIIKKNLIWKTIFNFTQYKTVINELSEGIKQLDVDGFVGTSIKHVPGQQFGMLYGGAFLRNEQGNMIIDDNPSSSNYGYPLADPTQQVVGNPNPKFILGINNSLTHKQWNLSFLFDMRVGNDMWNGTQGALTFFGKSKNTENRDNPGETSTVFSGDKGHLDANGNLVHFDNNGNIQSGTGESNSKEVGLNEQWYTGNGGGFGAVSEQFIQNASTYRLRNITLTYSLSPGVLAKIKVIEEANFYFTANNLLLFTPYEGIDPETSLTGAANNAQGLDYFNMPNTRAFTVGVRVRL